MNKEHIFKTLWIVILLLISSTSCNSSLQLPTSTISPTLGTLEKIFSPTTIPSTPTTISVSSPTSVSNETIKLTNIPTPVITLTSTNTSTIYAQIVELPVIITDSLKVIPEGNIVLYEKALKSPLYIFDLNSRRKELLGEAFLPFAISPDNKQLAFISTDHVLKIFNSKRSRDYSFVVSDNWRGVVEWVGQQKLLLENMTLFPDGSYKYPAASVLFDISTNAKVDSMSNYPGMTIMGNHPPNWGNHSSTSAVYDPNFTRVIFPGSYSKNDYLALILWDLENKDHIATFRGTDYDCGGGPIWMEDGSSFISCLTPKYTGFDGQEVDNTNDHLPSMGGFDLANISRDGKIERLTYLTTKYKAGEEGISLSPDETQLAFWLNLNYKPNDVLAIRQLAILNISTGVVTNLGIQGGNFPFPPTWSPDGKFLVVTNSNTKNGTSDVILIDLDQKLAVRIAENVIASGWITP